MRYCSSLLCGLILALGVSGCSDMNVNIPNPFDTTPSNPNDFYFEQFTDIPIPRDLSVDLARTFVSVTADGTKIGLVTTKGRVEQLSLGTAMINNMVNQGWSLRSTVNGPKILQVFEKEGRFAVLYFYEQTLSTAMEIWVSTRLPDGMVPSAVPTGSFGGGAGGTGGESYSGGGSSTSGGSGTPLAQ